MKHELVALIKSYLENVDIVLSLFRSKVGGPLAEKSWKANIPDNGQYADLGISKFHRHGVGVWAYYNNKFIDFDFHDSNLPELNDSQKFITIDVGFLASFIESLGIKEERWTDYNLLKEELNELQSKGIIERIAYKYYLKEDLELMQRNKS
jgi:hypothetical protein